MSEQVVELKTHGEPFRAMWDAIKTVELRKEDRAVFRSGDYLHLREFSPRVNAYTNRSMVARVTHCQRGYGLPDGMVAMSIKVCVRIESGAAVPHA